ncbi:hypothetical protein [Streptomyces sp. NPDC004721]
MTETARTPDPTPEPVEPITPSERGPLAANTAGRLLRPARLDLETPADVHTVFAHVKQIEAERAP